MAEQTQIKPEPDAGSPYVDEALDETPDLEFYDKFPNANECARMYLARLPSYLWQVWSQLDDDAEIEIGSIRQWFDKDGNLVSLASRKQCSQPIWIVANTASVSRS